MNKTIDEQINDLQKRINEAGIRDIKFFVDPFSPRPSKEEMSKEVIHILNSYFDGNFTTLPDFSDEVLPQD